MSARPHRFRWLACALPMLLALSAATRADPITVRDASGQTVAIRDTSRIVSIGGAITEILYALGLEQRVVAINSTSFYPPQALDEPTASLDLRHQFDLIETTRRCAARGTTVIAILHDLNLATLFADRVVVLHRGTVAGEGRPMRPSPTRCWLGVQCRRRGRTRTARRRSVRATARDAIALLLLQIRNELLDLGDGGGRGLVELGDSCSRSPATERPCRAASCSPRRSAPGP